MYWPIEVTETYVHIQGKLVKEDVLAMYTVRTMKILHLKVHNTFILKYKYIYFIYIQLIVIFFRQKEKSIQLEKGFFNSFIIQIGMITELQIIHCLSSVLLVNHQMLMKAIQVQ